MPEPLTEETPLEFWSTFSGVGGIDLGLERAGMRCTLQAESDEWCRAVLAARFPGVPCLDDVRDVAQGAESARPDGHRAGGGGGAHGHPDRSRAGAASGRAGRVDLLCGGFPCQDVSVAGKRAGLAGERSGLFHEFARIAAAVRPTWLLIENVPGLLTSNGGRDFGVVIGELAEIGYGVAWRVLDSRYFGVPQRRRRIFIVGHIGGDDGPALRALCESCDGRAAPRETTWKALAARPRDGASPSYAGGAAERDIAAPLLNLNGDAAEGGHYATYNVTPETGQGSDLRAGRVDTSGALDATALARSSERGVRIANASSVRRLTPRECERLQGFPDDWTLIDGLACPDSRRYGAMGNAVTVNVAEWIGLGIAAEHAREGGAVGPSASWA